MTEFEQTFSQAQFGSPRASEPPEDTPLSVSAAIACAKQQVHAIGNLVVSGEVSGFRGPNARSGHCYFQLKDVEAAMEVIVWKSVYEASGVELRDGLELQLKGSFDVYAPTGRLSFQARRLEVAGEGILRQRVAELAHRLEAEGLMAPERKRPIPRFCTRIAVVTSLSGSVIEDVLRTLKRRNPLVKVQLSGCQVQGAGAVDTIIAALRRAEQAAPEAILLVRGGGSFEDLMTFNDERLARAVAACSVPVICGIGHEPDTSICDMVCDRRASTPTAAAESVAPAMDELNTVTHERASRLAQAMLAQLKTCSAFLELSSAQAVQAFRARLEREHNKLAALADRPCMASPDASLRLHADKLALDEQRLLDAMPRVLASHASQLEQEQERLSRVARRLVEPYSVQLAHHATALEALSPLKVMARGYSIVRDDEGHIVSQTDQVKPNQNLEILVQDGSLYTKVVDISAREG